jgi:hypothetical protein
MLSTSASEQPAIAAMRLTMLLSAIMPVFLLSAPRAFARRAGQDVDPVVALRTALERGGFSAQTGLVSTVDWAGMYCSGDRADAGHVNKAPYLIIQVPESAAHPTPIENFKLRPHEAIVLIGPTPPPV